MVAQQRHPGSGFTAQELWESKLGAGVIGLLTNANNMLLQRSTAEWGRGAQGLQGQYRQPMTRPAIRRWHAWLFGFQGTTSHGNAEDENSAVWHAAAKAARHIQHTGAENASLVCVLEAYRTYAVMTVHPLHLCKPALCLSTNLIMCCCLQGTSLCKTDRLAGRGAATVPAGALDEGQDRLPCLTTCTWLLLCSHCKYDERWLSGRHTAQQKTGP
jgi:hypothetical protein